MAIHFPSPTLFKGKIGLYGFLLMLTATVAVSCNSTKKVTDISGEKIKVLTAEEYLSHRVSYKTFTGRLAFKLKTPSKNQSARALISMHRNKDIIASIRALGTIEVGKVYLRADSLFGINRIDKSAYALSYQDGTQIIKMNLPFASMQSLIMGTTLIREKAPIQKSNLEDNYFVIEQKQGMYLQKSYFDVATQSLAKLELNSRDGGFKCKIDFENYKKIGIGESFPYKRHIEIDNYGEAISIDVNFLDADIDVPVTASFSIPKSYKMTNSF